MTWWAYDIETEDWDTLVVGVAMADDGREVIVRRGSDARAWYRSLPSDDIVWSHNGGGFDFLHLISVCHPPRFEWTARMAGSSVIACRAKGFAECRDTSRLFPGSLAEWTNRKEALDLPCRCGENCGGYCSIRRRMSRPHFKRLLEYCRADCRALLYTLREDLLRLEGEGLAILSPRGGLPRLTFGGVAWHTASAEIDGAKETPDWAEYQTGRRGYYGGRNSPGRVELPAGVKKFHRFDVHAMYPAQLTKPVPHGPRKMLHGAAARKAYWNERPGVYRASIDVQETDVPPLPHRYNEPTNQGRLVRDRIIWSTGRIEGWWTQIELQRAEESGLAKIRKLGLACVWRDFDPLYEPYVRMIYAARDRASKKGDKRWAGILKWYANALSGKLAQRPDTCTIVITADPPKGLRHLGGALWARDSSRLSPCSRPIEAAYLTSRARILLFDRLYRNSRRWLYSDTDSTYLLDFDKTDVHESELGTWGYEGPGTDWLCVAPKLYRYRCLPGCTTKGHESGGYEHVRARGIPRPDWATLDSLLRGDTVRREIGVERLKTAEGDFLKRQITRSHRDWGGDDAGPWMREAIRAGVVRGATRCGTGWIEEDGSVRPLHRTIDGEYL